MYHLLAVLCLLPALALAQQTTCVCSTYEPCQLRQQATKNKCFTDCQSQMTGVSNPAAVVSCMNQKQQLKQQFKSCIEGIAGKRCSATATPAANTFGGGFNPFNGGGYVARHPGGRGQRSAMLRPYMQCVHSCMRNNGTVPTTNTANTGGFNNFGGFNGGVNNFNPRFRPGRGGGRGRDQCARELNCQPVRPTNIQDAKTTCETQYGTRQANHLKTCNCLVAAGVTDMTCSTTG